MTAAVSQKIRSLYADVYGDAAENEWRRLGAIDKAANIVSLCSSVPHRSILEIGAGEGAILQRLHQLDFGEHLYALEISQSGVAQIGQKAIPRLVEARLFDGYVIPYEDRRFDLAVLSHVVEHLEHPRWLLYEAARVARHVFVEVPLEDHARASVDFVLDGVGHINFYSQATIRKLLQSCDMEVVDQRVMNSSKAAYAFQKGRRGAANYYIKEALLRLVPRLATNLFTFHCALLCRPHQPDLTR